jgi:sulfate/thiosulfate transport system substrate-binding protein
MTRGTHHRPLAIAGLALTMTAALAVGALAQDATNALPTGPVSLVAYSTPREAYEEIIPLFQGTEAGAGTEFEQSYDASGAQSRAVVEGLPADVVALSLEPDITRLVDNGIVAADWNTKPYDGIVHDSVVVFAVRDGNPKNIQTWDDLIRDDVTVINPNVFTSGGAMWNVMAAYGAQIKAGKTDEEAIAYLAELYKHITVQDKSAREALASFAAGQGDVLLAYENEAITAQQKGEPIDYVIPEATLLIENPVAITTGGDALVPAQAFIDFLYTPEAQAVFGQKGYRPVVPEALAQFQYAAPAQLFTIADLGGWADVKTRFFDPDAGVVAGIFDQLGLDR